MLIKRTHLPSEGGGKTEGKLHLLSALCQPDRGWAVTNTIHQIPIENLFCWGQGVGWRSDSLHFKGEGTKGRKSRN